MPAAREQSPRPTVLICNHCRDSLRELADALARAGLQVFETGSLAESCEIADRMRPDAVVLSPLALTSGGVEVEMLQHLQRDDDPVPVLFLLDDLTVLDESARWQLPIRDFLRKPAEPAEGLHRIGLLLQQRRRHRAWVHRNRRLEDQISIDFKTGLLSERHFLERLANEWKRAQRHQNPLSLVLIDVDDFKSVNDSTEYSFGDEVLRKVGETLKATVRETDIAARLGGDEFCLLLPQTTPKEAVQTAMRIRQRVAETTVQKGDYQRSITVSMGIDAYDGRSVGNVEQLRSRANQALKEAKRRGKNQVWLYTGGSLTADRA